MIYLIKKKKKKQALKIVILVIILIEIDKSQKKSEMKKRKHTKISHKSKENIAKNDIIDNLDEDGKGKKVKFDKINVIDVESWKKLNLKLTVEENLDELIKLSEGKKERIKNISCRCIIFNNIYFIKFNYYKFNFKFLLKF